MTDTVDRSTLVTVVAAAGLLTGLALAGFGLSVHVEAAGYLAAGACDGCSPWHPLFVVAPLVVGTAAALGSGSALLRR